MFKNGLNKQMAYDNLERNAKENGYVATSKGEL